LALPATACARVLGHLQLLWASSLPQRLFPAIDQMKPATRSCSGAAMEVGTGVSKAGSKAVAAVSGRIQQQQVATKQVGPPRDHGSRSRTGPARDQIGRFIKSGSKVEAADPVPVLLKEAEVLQEAAVQDSAEDNVDSAEDEGVSSDGNEVSGHELEECDLVSSSANSDFDDEVVKELEETGNLNANLSRPDGGLLADQVFDHMPQSGPAVHGEKLSAVDTVRGHGGTAGVDQKAPWVNLFRDNRNLGKGIMLEEMEVEGDLVMLEEEDVDVVEEAWGFCLVGLFAGKFPGWAAVSKLREGWKVKCTQWRHRSGWLVFKFHSDEDRLRVLNGGPYFAYGSNLMLKILPSCFRFEGEVVSSVPIWVQLPGLPLDCWNARALSKIVSRVGKPITTDKMTLTKERLSFARVLVEVDVSSDIVSEVEIRLPTGEVYHQLVIAEFTPKFCKRCKSFGHVEGTCGKGTEGRQHTAYVAKKMDAKQKIGEASAVKNGDVFADKVQPVPIVTGAMVTRASVGPPAGAAPGVQAGATLLPPMPEMAANPIVSPLCPAVKKATEANLGGTILLSDQHGAAAVPHLSEVEDTRLVPLSVDGGWTSVGKKGKKKKKSVQSAVASAQQLPVAQQGVAAVLHQSDGDEGLAAVQQQSDGEGLQVVTPVPDRVFYPYVPRWKGKGTGNGR